MSALVQIDNEIITSSGTHTVNLTGIDSTFSTYMVKLNNVQPATDNKNINMRITKSGSAQSDSEYCYVFENLHLGTFGHTSVNDAAQVAIFDSSSNVAGEVNNAIMYLFNFPESSEYSHFTLETSQVNVLSNMNGYNGGGVHEVSSASDGVSFFTESSVDFVAGAEFALYGLKK